MAEENMKLESESLEHTGKIAESSKEEKRNDFKVELILFLIFGFLLGFTIKTEASKRITIGYHDYLITGGKQAYDGELQKEAAQTTEEQAPTE